MVFVVVLRSRVTLPPLAEDEYDGSAPDLFLSSLPPCLPPSAFPSLILPNPMLSLDTEREGGIVMGVECGGGMGCIVFIDEAIKECKV